MTETRKKPERDENGRAEYDIRIHGSVKWRWIGIASLVSAAVTVLVSLLAKLLG